MIVMAVMKIVMTKMIKIMNNIKNKRPRGKRPVNVRRIAIILIFVIYFIVQTISALKDSKVVTGDIGYTQLFEYIDNGEVQSIAITKQQPILTVNMKDGNVYNAVNPQSDEFIEDLLRHGANVTIQKQSLTDTFLQIFLSIPLVFILAIFAVYLSNMAIGGSTKMFTLIKPAENNVTFDSIKGISETKEEVKFAIDQLKNKDSLGLIGARPCKGLLFYGPPGTGKTLLAKAIANEANVPFVSASGSDFNEVFVGVGAARVRTLWEIARNNAPCIIFIDELDCVGKRRRGGDASTEYNQTINCLLQKMDGLNTNQGIMVIAATNMKEGLDPALLRPGRFDRQYFIGPPKTKEDRDEMVEFYLEDKLLKEGEFDVESASKLMVGLTGAEIEEVLNEAVYISLREDRKGVLTLNDVDEAVMKLHTSGVRQEQSSERDTEIVAVHEAGHTIVTLALGMSVLKTSIIPYSSGTGGVTMRDYDSSENQKLKLKTELENEICILLAGKEAEEIMFGEHTQGCTNDIQQATKLVYSMVTECGFGDKLLNENVLMELGVAHTLESNIISECNKILSELSLRAHDILNENREKINKLKNMLIQNRTVISPKLEDLK